MSIFSGRKRTLRGPAPKRHSFCSSLYARSLRCELLEDRRLLAQIAVTTDQDIVDLNDGVTSLREAIFAANIVPGADEIVFDFGHDGPATILLTKGELAITDALAITGPGAELLTITKPPMQGSIFKVDDLSNNTLITVSLWGMTLTGAKGTAIHSVEDLTVDSMIFRANSGGAGGGIGVVRNGSEALNAKLTVRNSRFEDNQALFPAIGSAGLGVGTGGGILFAGRFGELTIENTSFVGNSGHLYGGGVGVIGFSNQVNITDSEFVENRADRWGGGISITDDNAKLATLTRVNIKNNTAQFAGGGVYFTGKATKIVESEITGNRTLAASTTQGGGGGIFQSGGGLLTIERTRIAENHSVKDGGGITLRNSGMQISDSIVHGNVSGERGGGIAAVSSSLVRVLRTSITENIARGNGGGIDLRNGQNLFLYSSTLSGNESGGSGGGISAVSANTVYLSSVTVSGNAASKSGGGIYVSQDTTILKANRSTITANVAGSNTNGVGPGGGIFAPGLHQLHLNHVIVAGNTSSTGMPSDITGVP